MSYQVLARKWRPQRFADVVGQAHITQTLQNAIAKDRVGHAYLFVGPRGIGKTTSARIFAKALNCPQPAVDADGRLEPCCSCETCQEIARGSCLDVLEIDGASHNKVEDIRELRDTVQYTPTNGRRYKIFIIDEVHMLSTAAWNALLKTLEEPPPHVKFLFATTEAHKVLATIVSRCQRFDLKRIPNQIIVSRLRQIADAEQVVIDDDALTVIARAADGGMRDAQSIFDQLIAFCGGSDEETRIRESDVVDVFGLSSRHELAALISAMLSNQPGEVVNSVHLLADKGRDLERLYGDILLYLRNLMVFQVTDAAPRIVAVGETEAAEFQAMAVQSNHDAVQRLLEGLLSHDGLRHSLNKRLYIEATLLRVMRDAHAMKIDDVISHLRRLQEGGSLGDLPPMTQTPPAAVTTPVSAPPVETVSEPAIAPATPAAPVPPPAEPVAFTPPTIEQTPVAPPAEPVASAPPTIEQAPPAAPAVPEPAEAAPPEPMVAPATAPIPEAPVAEMEPEPPAPVAPVQAPPQPAPPEPAAAPPSPEPVAVRPPEPSPSVEPEPAPATQPAAERPDEPRLELTALQKAREIWHALGRQLQEAGDERGAELLAAATPLNWDGSTLSLGVVEPGAQYLSLAEVLKPMLQSLQNTTNCELAFTEHNPEPAGPRRLVSSKEVFKEMEANPFVQSICDLFDGRIVDVRG